MKEFFRSRKSFIALVQLVILATWLALSCVRFLVELTSFENDNFERRLKNVAQNNATAVEMAFDKYVHFLQMGAAFLVEAEYNENDFALTISNILELKEFSNLAIVLQNGDSYVLHNDMYINGEYEFTDQMAAREVYISEVYFDKYLKENAVSVNVPLIDRNNKLIAYLSGILTTQNLSEYFNKFFYSLGGYYNIVDSNGGYIAASDAENMLMMEISFYDAMAYVEEVNDSTVEKMLDDVANHIPGAVEYKLGQEIRMGVYWPININDWIVFSVIPEEIINEEVKSFTEIALTLSVNIIVVFFMLVIWVYRIQRDTIVLAEENARNLRFLAAQTKKYIIEWDFATKIIKISGEPDDYFTKKVGTITVAQNSFHESIHKDDLKRVDEALTGLRQGVEITGLKLRITLPNGKTTWCEFSAIPLGIGTNAKAYDRAIGFMEDIDEQERESKLLRKLSEVDSLTQIYNKGTTESLIRKIITRSEPEIDRHALLIIDLDNFKNLNDTYGHQFGDEVIVELATYLKSLFRQNDVVGRVGGDEFFVFMRDVDTEQLIVDKCENILHNFSRRHEEGDTYVDISVSIGISTFPQYGETFKSLYKTADKALYVAKEKGKNNYQFYKKSDASIAKSKSPDLN